MQDEVWVLGATGRTGRAVTTRLHEAGVALVLVGRDRARLEGLAAALGGAPRPLAGTLDVALAALTREAPGVVVNTVGCVGRLEYPFELSATLTCQTAAIHSGSAPPTRVAQSPPVLGEEPPMLTRLFRHCAYLGRSLTRALRQESSKKSGVSHESRRYMAWAGCSSFGAFVRRFAGIGWCSTRVYL